jgi:hypothetical protein
MMHDSPAENRNGVKQGMKNVILFVILITAACGAGGRTLPAQEPKGPRIEVKEEHYDAGKVVQGEQVVHVFDIRNAGDEVLEIQKVQTS